MTSSTKPEVHNDIVSPSEKNRDTAVGNMYNKFGEVRLCGFRVMQADRQTDRQRLRDIVIITLRTFLGIK